MIMQICRYTVILFRLDSSRIMQHSHYLSCSAVIYRIMVRTTAVFMTRILICFIYIIIPVQNTVTIVIKLNLSLILFQQTLHGHL